MHAVGYLKRTKEAKLFFPYGMSLEIEAFVDADFGNDLDTCKSHTGYVILLDGKPVGWKSKLQSQVALSTTESEILAAVEGVKEIIWWRGLLGELGFPQPLSCTRITALLLR